MNTKEFVKEAKRLTQSGYDNAPSFLENTGIALPDMLRVLTCDIAKKTIEDVLIDAGAIMWCMEQLGDDDGTDSEGGNQ